MFEKREALKKRGRACLVRFASLLRFFCFLLTVFHLFLWVLSLFRSVIFLTFSEISTFLCDFEVSASLAKHQGMSIRTICLVRCLSINLNPLGLVGYQTYLNPLNFIKFSVVFTFETLDAEFKATVALIYIGEL